MGDIRKGVYILPNLFTTASLLCGFYAIVHGIMLAIEGRPNFERCALAIVMAAFFDGMDGRVARKTKTATRFGVEYDSLSDLVSFGVAPAIILYLWALRDFGRIGWLAAFLYLTCGALRLARFNVQVSGVEKKYFQGLPIPMAAMMMVGFMLIWKNSPKLHEGIVFSGDVHLIILVMTYSLAGLMVSTIPYRSFKTLNLSQRHPFYLLVLIVASCAVLLTKPWWELFLIGCVYLASGPVEKYVLAKPVQVYQRVRQRRRVKKALNRIDDLASTPPVEDQNVHPFRRT